MPPTLRLILASASPRRRELLEAAGFRFEVRHADVDEIPRDGEPPRDYVRRLASEKASRVLAAVRLEAGEAAGAIVIGADTAVVVDDEILGKPEDDADARRMLQRLSGRPHLVLTGVSLRDTRQQVEEVEETTVWFSPLSADDLTWYVTTGEGRDKAGAYAIQGLAARFVSRIEGSYSNVVGLPVATVFRLLAAFEPGSPAVASGPRPGYSDDSLLPGNSL
jgi:septum formation protein